MDPTLSPEHDPTSEATPDAGGGESEPAGPAPAGPAPGSSTAAPSGDEPQEAAAGGASVPAVVAVVVTYNPGEWFAETLQALADQDYDNLSVLVIDNASEQDPTAVVAEHLPNAFVRRLAENQGFGAAANTALEMIEGAAFLLLCHDDCAPAPDAVRAMVEEAYRSNAGIVGPKLVGWDDPERLRQVGYAADKFGFYAPLCEPGELDQEQHDVVTDVFALPPACTLVRADLFRELGGFTEGIDFYGENLDLCWRSHVAGGRVLVAPAASARHREAVGERRAGDDRRRLEFRHRLRTMLACYSPFHLLRVVPQALVLAFLEVFFSLITGRFRQARDVAGAWWWAVAHPGTIVGDRRGVKRLRAVPDSEVRELQVAGSARISAYIRGQIGAEEDQRRSTMAAAGRTVVESLRSGPRRVTIFLWLAFLAVFLFGSRHLLTQSIPALREFAQFPDSPATLWNEWWTGWRDVGTGSTAPAPTLLGALGVLGYVFFGALGLLRTVLIVGAVPIGAFGIWRLLRGTGSSRIRAAALFGYILNPLPYNALGEGRWQALILYAGMPWVVFALARALRVAPFGEPCDDAPTGVQRRSLRYQVLSLGLATAVLAAFVPFAVLLVVGVAVVLVVGSFFAGQLRGVLRVLVVAAGAAVVAAVLHLPWTLSFLQPEPSWALVGGPEAPVTDAASFPDLVRFATGSVGGSPIGYALVIGAFLPVVIGRSWRFRWAVRGWFLVLASWALAWASSAGHLPFSLPTTDVLLAPGAVGLALAVAMGMAAFDLDLADYGFGWRQAASFVAFVAVFIATVPVLAGSVNGRWSLPAGDLVTTLSTLETDPADGGFRVLWIGRPDDLPVEGRPLGDGLVYATTTGPEPTVGDLYPGPVDDGSEVLGDSLELALAGGTNRLGRLVAPFGVKYIVVPSQWAPTPFVRTDTPLPEAFVGTISEQLDLAQFEVNPAVLAFENASWAPTVAEYPAGVLPDSDEVDLPAVMRTDFDAARPALTDESGYTNREGDLAEHSDLYVATGGDGWSVEVAGSELDQRGVFGWAQAYGVGAGGRAELAFSTPLWLIGAHTAEILVLVVLTMGLARARRRGGGEKAAPAGGAR
ncbi:MAG: glycosyltransferase family 2 protein [Actinobacteria bacterium]|nr:MAG: glycosyltransferase family 2 protein [Actinomycetota bacterium]RIK03366.1 MAG: hypothetical protein DCC48_16580 [Acidobacteriota bacterium]